jgi:ribosomal protein S7
MNTSIILKNTTTNNVRKSFINLMQYAIKKGNKNKIENIFRSLLFYIIKNPNLQNNFNFNDIFNAISNTSPKMSVKTKRKGSKNIYIPITITENHSKYLSSNWLITHSKLKNNNTFYKNLAEELNESSKKKSLSFKKCYEMHKLAEASLSNLKGKLK